MASNPQILNDLQVIMEADHDLELLTTYKGVPFVCKSKIVHIEGDVACLRTRDPAIVCLKHESHLRVLGSDFFEPAAARVASLDIAAGTVELTDFAYAGTKLGERMIVRVEPKEVIDVTITHDNLKTIGHLVDISLSGIGVRVNTTDYNPALKPGTIVHIDMELPNGAVGTPGIVLSAVKTPEFYRLSIRFAQEGQQKKYIFKYLIDRRAEIEREMRGDYKTHVKQEHAK